MFYARSARFFVDISRVNQDFSTFPREARFFFEYSNGKLKGFYARSASKILETLWIFGAAGDFFLAHPQNGGGVPGGFSSWKILVLTPIMGGDQNSQILSGSPP